MRRLPALTLVALTLGACSSGPTTGETAARPLASAPAVTNAEVPGSEPAARGLAFAQTHCSVCHAVAAGQISPNPEAPPFEAVANTPGLSLATLTPWLHNSHNFPEKMNFAIDPDQIDDLAAYMITLQKSDYSPPTQ